MYDHEFFVRTTTEFTGKLLSHYEIDDVLGDLADRLTGLLDLAGSGVTVGLAGELRAVTAVPQEIAPMESFQETHQSGPCIDAYRTGRAVAVPDLVTETRWPGYRELAQELGLRAVSGVPMRLGDDSVGALNLYASEPRTWEEADLGAAQVLANMATAYLINASSYNKQQQLSEQLQRALDSRVVIEQAKGVLVGAEGGTVEESFERIRRHARNHNATVREVATAVIQLGLRP